MLADRITATIGSARAGRGPQIALAALAMIAIVLLFSDTAADIVTTWYTSNAYNHGFLIIPICLYLACRQRSDLVAVEMRPDLRGIIFVALAALVWLLGHLTGTRLVQELSLVAAIQCVILTMFGWPLTRRLAFPLAYLYFAVPFGQAIEPRLQAITAALSVDMLRLVGVPVFADGNLISIPTGNFDVAEECSGLRFLIASIAIGTLFAGIMYRSWARRAAFLGLSLALPVLGNGARAFGIILLAYATSNQLAAGVDHIVYGWLFFTLIMFVMLAIGIRFREGNDARVTRGDGSIPHGQSAATHRFLLAGLVALAPLSVAKLYGNHLDQAPVIGSAHLMSPAAQAPWGEVTGAPDPLAPLFAGADAELHSAYASGTARAYLHIGYFLRDRRGAQAVSSAHDFEGGNGWRTAAAGTATVQFEDQPLSVRFSRSVRGSAGHLVWYWYWVDGQFTGDPYVAKLLETKAKLLGGERASAVIAISSDYANDSADAEKALRAFSSALRGLGAKLSGASRP
jgi:exosortase A